MLHRCGEADWRHSSHERQVTAPRRNLGDQSVRRREEGAVDQSRQERAAHQPARPARPLPLPAGVLWRKYISILCLYGFAYMGT